MKIRELIEILKVLDQDSYIYLNFERNFEDEFTVEQSDAGNYVLVPEAYYSELSLNQEFKFIEV